jgi:two-component system cell cycle response regulator CpdR
MMADTQAEMDVDLLSILYVEDNPELRENIGILMEADDREIVTCATAEEALAINAMRHFDLVVTDVSLPGMSGTELARRLLQNQPTRWIALCSGFDFGHAIEQLGVHVRALQKPFEIEDLDLLIAQVRAARGA